MATEATNTTTKSSLEPRVARRTIMAAARRVHARDGAEAFSLARVAAEAGVPLETVSAHFQNKQELLVAIAAEDLTSLAGAMREPPESASQLPQSATGDETGRLIRKKAVMPPALDQVMKEVAPEPENASGGTMARLERRIYVLERAFADIVERHEKSLRERQSAASVADESVGELRQHLDTVEKNNAQMLSEWRASMNDAASRLNALELGHASVSSVASNAVDGPQIHQEMPPFSGVSLPEILPESVIDNPAAPLSQPEIHPGDESQPANDAEAKESKEETYLSAARRAAMEAQRADAASDLRGGQPKGKSEGGKSRLKLLLFGCAAPVVILAVSVMVLNRHTVTAEPARAVRPSAPPPQVVVAPPADPIPTQFAHTQSLDSMTSLAQGGDVGAMRDLGLKYLAGDGVPTNEAEAARWLMQAAYKGEPTAEYWLGTLYARGRGVPVDVFQANHWYEAAAKQGNRRAMHSLAVSNFQGWGMEKNFPEAIKWFSKSAELGFRDSQFNLAVMYERGSGVPQSMTDAYKWYAVAAFNGDKEAESRLAILAGQMKPADLALAQQAAAGFKPLPLDQHANLASGPKELPGG